MNISALRPPRSALEDSAIRNPHSALPLPFPWRRMLRRFEELDSTQSEANRRVAAGEAMGGVVLWSERQNAGRGRLDHRWVSESGGLYVTAGLPYDLTLKMADTGWISLIAALAAVEALSEDWSVAARIKWPNDLIVQGRKIGGLLGEVKALKGLGAARLILIGMGLNWANEVDSAAGPGASAPPGSLVEFRPGLSPADREPFLSGWLARLNRWHDLLAQDYHGALARLRCGVEAVLWRKDEVVTLKHTERGPVEGRLLGLGAGGAARLETAPGELREVHCGWQEEIRFTGSADVPSAI